MSNATGTTAQTFEIGERIRYDEVVPGLIIDSAYGQHGEVLEIYGRSVVFFVEIDGQVHATVEFSGWVTQTETGEFREFSGCRQFAGRKVTVLGDLRSVINFEGK